MALGLIYGLLFKMNQKQGAKFQGLKCFVIVLFMFVAITSFLKPWLHLSTAGEIRIEEDTIHSKFSSLELFTS
jgi:hypothetical protein